MKLASIVLARMQIRLGLWLAETAVARIERRARLRQALTREPRSLPPFVAG